MSLPRREIGRYLEREFPGAAVERLAGDASTRIFYRIRVPGGQSVVLMDYVEPFDGETDDIRLGKIFRDAGLRVAGLLRVSAEVGCLVLEDLGDHSLETLLHETDAPPQGPPPQPLVRAVELAALVASKGTPLLARSDRAAGPALDAERFRFEMDFFLEHFAAGLRGIRELPEELRGKLHGLADRAAASPRRVLCHRDFHSRNLMVLDDGSLAMVDVQDARWGPDTYDLVSILRDAYIEIEDAWIDPLIQIYLEALDDPPEPVAFGERFQIVAAQRMIKALGSFGYLTIATRGGRYLDAIPRTVGRLRTLLPKSKETKDLFEFLTRSGLLNT
jgi:aminoglycoside/choline kinase family phosphotransferase